MRLACTIAILTFLATPASAELRIPCLWNPFGGCSFSFVSPEYAKKPVQPLDPDAALAAINAFRAENGRKPLVLDERLSRAAAMQSEAQAGRSWIGHSGAGANRAKPIGEALGKPGHRPGFFFPVSGFLHSRAQRRPGKLYCLFNRYYDCDDGGALDRSAGEPQWNRSTAIRRRH